MNYPDTHNTTMSDGRFELLEHLGTGGFAQTWRARVLDEDIIERFDTNEVALKIPLSRAKELVLQDEIEMNAALHMRLEKRKSIYLVRYLGLSTFRNQFVMAMEYVPQGSLRKVLGKIGRQKRLSVNESAEIAEGVLKGLEIIHQEHVFHRDIKPENILMEGAIPKISDLGIARMLDSNEMASSTVGTVCYMSPEMLGEEGASFNSDIWSVGVTLYEMVTGRLPFGGPETPIGKMSDLIRQAMPTSACEVCPEVPSSLNDIIMRALAKRPADRYATSREMYEEIERFKLVSKNEIEKEIMIIRKSENNLEMAGEVERKYLDVIARYPRDSRGYQALGMYYNKYLKYDKSIAIFKKGIDCDNTNAILYWALAVTYQKIGRVEPGIQCLEKAISLGLDTVYQRHAAFLLRSFKGEVQ